MFPENTQKLVEDLGLSSQKDILSFEPITPGFSSELWKVQTAQGSYILKKSLNKLRVQDDWYISTRRNKNEFLYLKCLSEGGLGVSPNVIAYDSVNQYFLMEFIDSPFPNWKAKLLEGRVDEIDFQNAATTLGKTHTFFYNHAPYWETFNDIDLFFQTRLSPYWETLIPKHPDLNVPIRSAIDLSTTHKITVIHGDASPKNFIPFSDKHILLDAECAFWGDPAYDLAFLLSHVFLKGFVVSECSEKLPLNVQIILDSYAPYNLWGPGDLFLKRIELYLLLLILARVDGKARVEYINSSDRLKIINFVKDYLSNASARPIKSSDPNVLSRWQTALKVIGKNA